MKRVLVLVAACLGLAACDKPAPDPVQAYEQSQRAAERPGSFQMLEVGKNALGGVQIEVLDTRTGELTDCIVSERGSACSSGGKAAAVR